MGVAYKEGVAGGVLFKFCGLGPPTRRRILRANRNCRLASCSRCGKTGVWRSFVAGTLFGDMVQLMCSQRNQMKSPPHFVRSEGVKLGMKGTPMLGRAATFQPAFIYIYSPAQKAMLLHWLLGYLFGFIVKPWPFGCFSLGTRFSV